MLDAEDRVKQNKIKNQNLPLRIQCQKPISRKNTIQFGYALKNLFLNDHKFLVLTDNMQKVNINVL